MCYPILGTPQEKSHQVSLGHMPYSILLNYAVQSQVFYSL